LVAEGKQITVSDSHRKNPKTGKYDVGGPFYTSRVTYFASPGHVENLYSYPLAKWYTGPVMGKFPTDAELFELGRSTPVLAFGDKNESQLAGKGTTAIAQCAPNNPASDLATGLAESFKEGVPSLFGIQSWERKLGILKSAGSEYLNYQFGWAPLASEIRQVRDAARHHRDILHQYHKGEGHNTHRRFDFSPTYEHHHLTTDERPLSLGVTNPALGDGSPCVRKVSRIVETKCYFEGCFTYGLPSSSDNWRKALGFGSDADQLFGIALNPDILWELTPWSWAVDWFSNAGDLVHNVTNFGLAGLVMRYGYMMEETIERVTAENGKTSWYSTDKSREKDLRTVSEPSSCGFEIVTKRRVPASPFGFSTGWQDLSPTQLAITAAIGITRLL